MFLTAAADGFWSASVFERSTWNTITFALRLVLTLGAALFFLYLARSRRLARSPKERTLRWIGIAISAVAFLTYFDFFNPNVRYRDFYHRGDFFNNYLAAKYAPELGYERLYDCVAVAEIENGRGVAVEGRPMRDLRDNHVKPFAQHQVSKDPERCRSHFRDAAGELSPRWDAFKKDVTWFESKMRGDYWANAQKDHGFNAPPAWVLGAAPLANLGPASHELLLSLASIDIALQLGAILLLGWAFGWRVMTVAAVFWGCNFPSSFFWVGGGFLRFDWVFFLVAATCFIRKRRFALGGAALAASTLLRAFPILFCVACAIVVLVQLVRTRALHADHRRLIAGFAIASALLVPASMVATASDDPGRSLPSRLVQPYVEWTERITTQKGTPLTNNMGLDTVLAHDWDGRMRFARNDQLHDPFSDWKDGQIRRVHSLRVLLWALVLLGVAWTGWALHKTRLLWIALGLGAPLVVLLTSLPCYYYSFFVVVAPLAIVRPAIGPLLLVTTAASQIIGRSFYWVDDKYAAQSWLFLALSVCVLFACSRPFDRARLSAWWRGAREARRGGAASRAT